MINTALLKEESNQAIFLNHKGTHKKGKFMWFNKGNIEIILESSITLLSVSPRHFSLLSLSEA